MWQCQCDCGATKVLQASTFTWGGTVSCGCYARESTKARSTTHGLTGTPLYSVWLGMIGRTTYASDPTYARYGGRGIRVCERWRTFANFFADMSPTYEKGLSIDRIDNDGNYEPGNCRWATDREQQRNKGNNHVIEWRGEARVLADWVDVTGIHESTIRRRLERGWSVERALTAPPRYGRDQRV